MLTVGLLAVVVYLYTVVAFNFFRKFYNKSEDEDEPDMKCDDMMTVRLTTPNIYSFMTKLCKLKSPSFCGSKKGFSPQQGQMFGVEKGFYFQW